MTILDFQKRKRVPISMVSAYDAWSAGIIADSDEVAQEGEVADVLKTGMQNVYYS